MDHKLAIRLCNFFLKEKIIFPEYYDIYLYGSELLISFTISTFIIMLIGLLIDRFIQTILFLTIFIIVRGYTGGYHATSHLRCKLSTILTYFSVLFLSETISIYFVNYIIILILGSLVLLKIGPIENPNKPISAAKKHFNQIIGIILFVLILISSALLHIKYPLCASYMYYTLMAVIVLMVIADIQSKLRKKGGCTHEMDR